MLKSLSIKREVPIIPPFLSGLRLYLDSSDSTTITKAYQNLVATGTGTVGTNTITASGVVTNLIQPGMKLRISGTDIYTVASVATPVITTVELLSTSYVAQIMAVDRVSQWNDKSGFGNHATQGTALIQLIYNPARLNGQAVLTGDGASYMFANGVASIMSGSDKAATVFSVTSTGVVTSNVMYAWGTAAVATGAMQLKYQNPSNFAVLKRDDANLLKNTTAGTSVLNTHAIFSMVNRGIAANVYRNNTLIIPNADIDVATTTTDRFVIGASFGGSAGQPLNGDIARFLVYNREFSIPEIIIVNRFLAQNTGILIT